MSVGVAGPETQEKPWKRRGEGGTYSLMSELRLLWGLLGQRSRDPFEAPAGWGIVFSSVGVNWPETSPLPGRRGSTVCFFSSQLHASLLGGL